MDIYETCPEFWSDRFLLRQVSLADCDDLLKVYSDPAAWPLFNSDNCTGDFHMTRKEDMENCIRFWLQEYGQRYYVRWSIIDRNTGHAVGTVELFNRKDSFSFASVGLLRLDLRSDYETEHAITDILAALLPEACDLFTCSVIATKIPPRARERLHALLKAGFQPSQEPLYAPDGVAYGDYYLLAK